MNEIFKKGDIVYHWKYGKGEVTNEGAYCYVKYENNLRAYIFEDELSFTPYTLENGGFSQVRPKVEFKVGDFVKSDMDMIILVTERKHLSPNYQAFSGVVVSKGSGRYDKGYTSDDWYTPVFKKIDIEIKIK